LLNYFKYIKENKIYILSNNFYKEECYMTLLNKTNDILKQ